MVEYEITLTFKTLSDEDARHAASSLMAIRPPMAREIFLKSLKRASWTCNWVDIDIPDDLRAPVPTS
jgi:hypothetical protein